MRGRKPKPTALKILEGNPGHRPIDTLSEPEPVIGLGAPPEYLDAEAKKFWMAQGPELVKLRTLGESDAATFATMCMNHSRILWLTSRITALRQKKKLTNADEQKLDKYESQRMKTIAQFNRTGAEFGMGAASRTRIKVKPDDGQNEFDFTKPTSPLERAMLGARSA
jgi:P27 family predicted phage terminase small subunit